MLLLGAPLSRAELAERTGLSRPAITEICRDLVEHGLVQETGARTPSRSAVGRRHAQLDLCADAGYARGGAGCGREQCGHHRRPEGPAGGLRSACSRRRTRLSGSWRFSRRREAASYARLAFDPARLVGVGVSVPGVVDSRAGRLRLSPFFGWVDVPLRSVFESTFGPRVSVANPLQAIAVGGNAVRFGGAAADGGAGAGQCVDRDRRRVRDGRPAAARCRQRQRADRPCA